MSIKTWPEGERPREKLLEKGAGALSDAELLAVLLRTGTQGASAVDVARGLLADFGSLNGLMNADLAALTRHKGMGEAAYCQFAVVREIAHRLLAEDMRHSGVLANPAAVGDYLVMQLAGERVEAGAVLLLNAQNRLLAFEILSRGSVSEHKVYLGQIVRLALQHQAAAVIFAHNHPSGSAQASDADLFFTRRLAAALALVDIALLDHFIVTDNRAHSFVQKGWWQAT